MIPALMGRKKAISMIIGPNGAEPEEAAPQEDEALVAVAEDLVSAVASKDARAVADAFRAAYNLLEAEEMGEEEEYLED